MGHAILTLLPYEALSAASRKFNVQQNITSPADITVKDKRQELKYIFR
jgi:hypothetical protein